ncbi:Ribonuclease 3-like protein 3 [Linum perenne]
MEYPLHSNGLVNLPKTLADLIESLIGAVFIDSDCSVDTVWKGEVATSRRRKFPKIERLKTHWTTLARFVVILSHEDEVDVRADNDAKCA